VEAIETALIVPIPEAETAVGPFRAGLDRAARWGVPAHVTVLYPFLDPDAITDTVLAAVQETVAATPRFAVEFTHVGWFGDRVAWLAPRPDEPFRALTEALWRRFPDRPPYGGAHAEVVPHLTLGHDAPQPALRDAADAVAAHLPLRATPCEVWLMVGAPEPDSWHTAARFAFGDAERLLRD